MSCLHLCSIRLALLPLSLQPLFARPVDVLDGLRHLRHHGVQVKIAVVVRIEARVCECVHRTGSLEDLLEQGLIGDIYMHIDICGYSQSEGWRAGRLEGWEVRWLSIVYGLWFMVNRGGIQGRYLALALGLGIKPAHQASHLDECAL